MPVVTAIAACCTVAQGAPPPKWMRLKCVSSSMPSPRMISLSGLVSIVNVDRPSTWLGSTPGSANAATHASSASWSSLRPESLENSVAPMPTIAARLAYECLTLLSSLGQLEFDGAGQVGAELVRGLYADDDASAAGVHGLHAADEGERQVGVGRRTELHPQRSNDGLRPAPVRDVALQVAKRRVDVEEDVPRALLLSKVAIVMHVLKVPGRERASDDVRRRQRQRPQREAVALGDRRGFDGVLPPARCCRTELRQADRPTRVGRAVDQGGMAVEPLHLDRHPDG